MPHTKPTPPECVHVGSDARGVGCVCFSEERRPLWRVDELMPNVGSRVNAVPDNTAASENTVASAANILVERVAMNFAVQL